MGCLSFSRGSSQPRDQTAISHTGRWVFTTVPPVPHSLMDNRLKLKTRTSDYIHPFSPVTTKLAFCLMLIFCDCFLKVPNKYEHQTLVVLNLSGVHRSFLKIKSMEPLRRKKKKHRKFCLNLQSFMGPWLKTRYKTEI